MKKDFIEILQDIKAGNIAEGTKIKNVETGEKYEFANGIFRRENISKGKFIRANNLNAEFEILKNEINLYDIVEFCGYEWYVIKQGDETSTLLMKELLKDEDLTRYFSGIHCDGGVKFATSPELYWRDSDIRMNLNSVFADEKFNRTILNLMENIIGPEEDKSLDYVRLLTEEEAKKLPKKILKSTKAYWTMSPSLYNGWFHTHVFYLGSTGYLDEAFTWYSLGVRPVINLDTENLKFIASSEVV